MYHYFTSVYHRSWWYDPQFLIYRMCHSEISNFRSFFFAYLPPSKPKKSALFYTCAPKVTITWCMAPEIHNETERIFCYFAYFFPPFYSPYNLENQNFEKMKKLPGYVIILHVDQKSQSYDVCFLRYGVQQTDFVVILGQLWQVYPSNNPEN